MNLFNIIKAKKRDGGNYLPDAESVNEYFYTDGEVVAMEKLQLISDTLCCVSENWGIPLQEFADSLAAIFNPIITELHNLTDEKQTDRERSKRDIQSKRKQSRGKN